MDQLKFLNKQNKYIHLFVATYLGIYFFNNHQIIDKNQNKILEWDSSVPFCVYFYLEQEQQLIYLLILVQDSLLHVEKWGQRIGLGYGVFKAILKLNLPKDIVKSNEFIKLMRQTEQQANALNRELKTSLHKIKQEIKEQIPDEIKKNPHLSLQLKDYRKSNQNSSQNQLYGSGTIIDAFEERNRLKQAKAQKDKLTGFTKSL